MQTVQAARTQTSAKERTQSKGATAMKAFLASAIAIAVISVGSYYYLNGLGWTAAETFQSDNVRLDN